MTKVPEPLDNTNWGVWKKQMKPILCLCSISKYIEGVIQCPTDPKQQSNWDYNDNYAQVLIENNILSSQNIHMSPCETSCAMWGSLEAVHESKGHEATIAIMRNLFHTIAGKDTNIVKHLNTVKEAWECMNVVGDKHLHISDPIFKVIISSSLPCSWDTSISPYMKDIEEEDPKDIMSSQKFIGIVKKE